jgi:ribose/xylose/arabinose/galactoside ABC-type transport system permease subunit
MITQLGMNNFIVTLAMQLVLRGLALMLNKGNYISGTPKLFNWLGAGRVGPTYAFILLTVFALIGIYMYVRNSRSGDRLRAQGQRWTLAAVAISSIVAAGIIWLVLDWIGAVPVQIIFTGLAFVVANYYLTNSRFGRQLYAVGGNADAARASGFSPKRTITIAYMISGFLAAVAAWMLLGRLGEATDKTGVNLTLETVAASVIGGVALTGGYGSVLGAFSGVLLLSIVDNGLNLMQVNPFWVNGIRGAIILAAIFIEAQKFRFKPRVTRSKESP